MRARLLSFSMILNIAFLLVVSLVFGAVLAAMGKLWAGMFAMIYKIMPRVSLKWRDVWLGAIVTSLPFTAGSFLIEIYIGTSNLASGFGAAGSLNVVVVFVHYSAQVFLLGAELTWIQAKTFGSMRDVQPYLLAKIGIPAPGTATKPAARLAQSSQVSAQVAGVSLAAEKLTFGGNHCQARR